MRYIMYHSMSDNRTGSREWRQAGVLGGMALVAMLVGALALARPVEAQLSCPDKNAQCLIDKINEANRKGQGTIIYLGKGPYTLTAAPITYADRTWNALPSITGSVTIVGSGAGITAIERPCSTRSTDGECSGDDTRIFHVAPGGYLGLVSVTVQNGKAGKGGGFFNEGSLEMWETTVRHNHAHEKGGGIYNRGWVALHDTTVNDNFGHSNGSSRGGGIYIEAGLVEIAHSTINHNRASFGGGIANDGGEVLLWDSTISSNHATAERETGQANAGGLLNAAGPAWLKNVTITANVAYVSYRTHAGGVYGQGNVYFSNTIMAGNPVGTKLAWFGSPLDCIGQVITLGGNLVGDPGYPEETKHDGTPRYPCEIAQWTPRPPEWPAQQAPDHIGRITTTPLPDGYRRAINALDVFVTAQQDPKDPRSYAPKLADNGGTSCTHALCTTVQQIPYVDGLAFTYCTSPSPAIDRAWTGNPGAHPFTCETYDQRWIKRPVDGDGDGKRLCDIGAFEHKQGIAPSGLGCR